MATFSIHVQAILGLAHCLLPKISVCANQGILVMAPERVLVCVPFVLLDTIVLEATIIFLLAVPSTLCPILDLMISQIATASLDIN